MLDPSYLLTDPMFYAVAVPAVILVGLSKGGLGGAAALMGVPVMALAMHPVQAAAILLPILIVMDAVSLWTWRHWRDFTTLKIMLPGAITGIARFSPFRAGGAVLSAAPNAASSWAAMIQSKRK